MTQFDNGTVVVTGTLANVLIGSYADTLAGREPSPIACEFVLGRLRICSRTPRAKSMQRRSSAPAASSSPGGQWLSSWAQAPPAPPLPGAGGGCGLLQILRLKYIFELSWRINASWEISLGYGPRTDQPRGARQGSRGWGRARRLVTGTGDESRAQRSWRARPWKLDQNTSGQAFEAGLEGLKAMEIEAKQYDKRRGLFWTSKRTVATGLGTHKEKKVWVDIHVQAAGSQICLHNMCGQQRNSPMADPIFGSKYGPQNGVQNWITFSFLLLGLCLGPVLGSRFGPKSGVGHRRILLLPAEVLQADLRRTSMSVSVNTCFFSLCVPLCFLYSSNRTWDAQREKGMSWHSCSSCRVANLLAQHVRAAAKFSDGWPHFWVQIWTPKWGPELDSFLLLGLCLGPVLGSRFGPKSGVSHRRILLLPAEVLQADLRRTSMSVSVNTCFFSLCVPLCFLYSSNRTWDAQREKGMSWHSCSSCRVANLLAQHVRAAAKFSDGWPHFWVQIWTPKWGPELDHIFIPSFRSLLGPRFGIQIWTQKWGQPSENFAAARRGFASRFATH